MTRALHDRTPTAPDADAPAPPLSPGSGRLLRIAAGAILIVLSMLPVYRLLNPAETGFAGEVTVWFMEIQLEFVWYGLMLVLPVALAAAVFMTDRVEQRVLGLLRISLRPRLLHYALALALLSALLGSLFSLIVLEGQPNLIDSFAQLLQARYWAAGRIAGPASDMDGFWAIQNSLFTPRGWVSQYPPGHVLVLAAFLRLGIPWAAGPVLMGVAVFFTTLVAHALLPGRPLAARLGPALLAVSPFFIVIGASYMNHVVTAAFVSVGAWALLRAWHEQSRWSVLAGAAFGWSLATRPVATVAMGAALYLLVPFTTHAWRKAGSWLRITAGLVAGAVPFALLLCLYNSYLFGSPLRFGYQIAMGPRMRLGFLRDPWGNLYGVREAIAYTSADLMALGVNMFESPLSAVLVIGLFLLAARRIGAGERVVIGWALALVASNFFYWHHGNFMGPRMLHEGAPAWVLLFALAASGLVRRIPAYPRGRLRPRSAAAAAIVASTAFGLLVMAPQRALSYGGGWHDVTRTPVPDLDGPALVFVHDAWVGRVGMTLASNGYRLDQIETLMRQNSTCRMQQLADAIVNDDVMREGALLAQFDTVPRASGGFPGAWEIAPGDKMRAFPGEQLTAECSREVRSDRNGILDIAPLLWRGDLPDATPTGPLFARDLGPERNAQLIARYPDRQPWVYMLPDPSSETPVLLPYGDGMQILWGTP